MRITRETDYAVRCILYLSERPGETVAVSEISDAMAIPQSFLPKIVQKLVRGGLLESVKGVKGGISLSRRPEAITLLDVMEMTEGPLSLNVCMVHRRKCDRNDGCAVHPVWTEIQALMEKKLRACTFKKLLQER